VPIPEIRVGERFRRDNGDIRSLADSMHALGLLQPIGLTPDYELVFGGRRLAAAMLLGWEEIQATILDDGQDAAKLLRAERDENTCREPMKPSELVALGRAIESLEREAAKKRLREAGRLGGKGSGKLPEASTGDTRDKVADALGIGASTYERAKRVTEAAEADPETYGDLPALMDTRSVHAAHEELRRRQEPPPADEPGPVGETEADELGLTEPEPPPAGKRKLPKGFRPGNHVDPDHPYAAILHAASHLAGLITRAMAAEGGERLKDYLTAVQVAHQPHPLMVSHRALMIAGKRYGAQFVGLRPLRRLVHMAGLPGRAKPAAAVVAAYTADGREPEERDNGKPV